MPSFEELEQRIASLELAVRQMKALAKGEPGRDGRDGRDAKQLNARVLMALRPPRPQLVHVEPARVTLHPQAVHVAAPSVTVESPPAPVVNVNLPPRELRTIRFEQDKHGNITGATG